LVVPSCEQCLFLDKGCSNSVHSLLLRRFVFENADGDCERFRYGSKEVADDGGIRDRFFSSSQFLANGEQTRDVFSDRRPRLHRRGMEPIGDVVSAGFQGGRVVFLAKEFPDAGRIIDFILGKTAHDGSDGRFD